MKSPLKYLLGFALIASLSAQAADDVNLLETGSGYKRVRLTQEARNAIFESNTESITEIDTAIKTRTNYDVVIVDTYGGLFTSRIPEWAIMDYLNEKGISRADAAGPLKNTKIDQVSFDLVALSQLTASDNRELFPETTTSNEGWLCKKEWKNGSKSVSASPVNKSQSLDKTLYKNSTLDLSTKGNAAATGTISASIEYRTKRNKCIRIPYKAELVKASFDAKLNINANPSLVGKALVEYKKNLFNDYVRFWNYSNGWWVYIFYISLDMEVGMTYGANLSASLAANLDAGYNIAGTLDARYECTKNGCTDVRKISSVELSMPSHLNYSAQLDIALTPYADLAVQANVDLYKIFEMGEMKLGVAAGLPIRYFGYVGNTCSDANMDGSNETVRASLLDVTGQSYMYLQYDSFVSKKTTKILDVNPFGWIKVQDNITFGPMSGVNPIYVRNFAFKNLGGDDIFNPVLQFTSPLPAVNGSISLAKRSCYPFSAAPVYEVDYGDGVIQRTSNSPVAHNWASTGAKTIRARIVGDSAGRSFNPTQWTTRAAQIATSISSSSSGGTSTGGKIYEFNDPIKGNTPGCTLTQTYGGGGGGTVYYRYALSCPGHQVTVEKMDTGGNCTFIATPKNYSISGSCTNWRVYN